MIEKTMAAVLQKMREIKLEEIKLGGLGDDQALIKIKNCGICSLDVGSFTGLRKVDEYPCILGHEWVGEIIDIGKNSQGFNIGDRVAVDWRVTCGNCYYCRKGIFNHCKNIRNDKVKGGFCEYGISVVTNLCLIPENVSYEEATLTEPLACCVNGIKKSNISAGDDVVVIGCGPMGLLLTQLAKHRGARVIACDFLDNRLKVASDLGADDIINTAKEDANKKVMELTKGIGANSVIVAIGTPEAAQLGINVASIYGTVNLFVGNYPSGDISLDLNVIHYKELNLTGSCYFTHHDFVTALKLIQYGIINAKSLISHILPLSEISSAFDIIAERRGLKVILEMG
ncbi:MAG: zinc-dependent alcohol dehydrogenase [bacterium]